MAGRPLKFKTPEELQEKIDAYFRSCIDYKRDLFGGRIIDKEPDGDPDEKGVQRWIKNDYVMEQIKPFTVSGLAAYLETTRDTLMDYETKYGDEFSDTIKKAKQKIYAYTEESLFMKGSATGAIFSLKNNYDWKDKKEIENSGELGFNINIGYEDEEE